MNFNFSLVSNCNYFSLFIGKITIMRLIMKTMEKVVIEVHTKEVENDGFDYLWDKIRNVYKIDEYEIFNIEKDKNKTLIYVELIPLRGKEVKKCL